MRTQHLKEKWFGFVWNGFVWFGFLCFCSLSWSLLAYVPNLSSLCALCVLQLILLCVVPTFKMCDIFFLFFLNGVRSRTLPILCMGSVENLASKDMDRPLFTGINNSIHTKFELSMCLVCPTIDINVCSAYLQNV